MKKFFSFFVLSAILFLGVAFAEEAAHSEFSGTWKLKDTDGTVFHATLNADGTSKSDWGPGETGTWKQEGNQARVSWTDGWRDVIIKDANGYRKLGYAPEVPETGEPTNNAPAEKMS